MNVETVNEHAMYLHPMLQTNNEFDKRTLTDP